MKASVGKSSNSQGKTCKSMPSPLYLRIAALTSCFGVARLANQESTQSLLTSPPSKIVRRPCKLDEKNPVNEDYVLWSPKHPMQDNNCLFGHVSQYHRKRLDAKCYNGKNPDSASP